MFVPVSNWIWTSTEYKQRSDLQKSLQHFVAEEHVFKQYDYPKSWIIFWIENGIEN